MSTSAKAKLVAAAIAAVLGVAGVYLGPEHVEALGTLLALAGALVGKEFLPTTTNPKDR